ncbi:MAG TPA: ATP synthase F1 subunit gamma [Bellilinea sp.]|jgi:F-type H+-transporting ATPase subunit gamma|nr:ATP synthase F1 subunit gamma [Bellilinea sp.]
MASTREMRLRIRSIKNLAQVTRALETVSTSEVRKAVAANERTKAYALRAWKVLMHLARQPGAASLHPLLTDRDVAKRDLVIMVSADRGLAGAYIVNIVRSALNSFKENEVPVDYVTVGRRGRDMLIRRRRNVIAEFPMFNSSTSFTETAAIGQLVVDEFLNGKVDEVYIVYTEFKSMMRQEPVVRKLLPLKPDFNADHGHDINFTHPSSQVFTYEPDPEELLDQVVPRFVALQIYQAILSSAASEHAARRLAMSNATKSANELVALLNVEYNKVRQAGITSDILDISGGAEALAQATAGKG